MNTEHAEIYRNLLCYIFKFSKPEDYIYHLFNFIKENVPAKSIICFNMERKKKLISIFVDYNLNVFSQYSYTCNVSDIIPWDYMYSLFNKNGDPIIYINDISKYPILEKHVSHMPINIKSCITLQLFIDKENERLHSCIVYSDETDVFTQEHVEFMSSLRPILKRISQSFFMEDVDEDFTISTMNRLPSSPETLLRRCPDMRDIMRRVEAVAPLPTTVLISGPSGSGKELVAETIHALSGRNKAPLIKVNCGALPESLLESELFGYEKGAFTGAMNVHHGYLEQAHGGTLFLDEIGELSLNAQTRLLRILEGAEVLRVGGERPVRVDARIVAATNRDLREMVRKKKFREDLYYRLFVYPIVIPPLRKRPQDLPILIKYFFQHYVKEFNISPAPSLSLEEIKRLASMPWHGNVRELRAAIERYLINYRMGKIGLWEVDGEECVGSFSGKRIFEFANPAMKENIYAALEECGGRIQGKDGAASLLGIAPSTLRSRMKALGIALPRAENKK